MSDDCDPPSGGTPDPQVEARALSRSWADKGASVAKLSDLECLLFDGDDHVRRDTSPEEADRLLGAVNDLRRQLGWLCLDLGRHHCWPEDTRRAGGSLSRWTRASRARFELAYFDAFNVEGDAGRAVAAFDSVVRGV